MSQVWITILILIASSILVFLYKFFSNIFGFSGITHSRADLYIAVINHDRENNQIKIKIACAANNPLIIKNIELVSRLSFGNRRENFLGWFQIARAYFVDDQEGLQGVFILRKFKRESAWVRKSFNVLLGLLFSLFILSTIYHPFGWLVLSMGPYPNVKIKSSKVVIKDSVSNQILYFPFLIKPAEERELLIDYAFSVKEKGYIEADAKYFNNQLIPNKSNWILPRLGQYILHGKVKLKLNMQGFLTSYALNLSKEKDNFILDAK